MTPDYRALCAELVDDLELCDWPYKLKDTIRADIERARALLAQPVAEGPTNETPWEIDDDDFLLFSPANAMAFQAQKRSRRSRPTPQPPADAEAAELAAELRHFVAGYQQMRGLDPEHVYSIHRGDAMEAHLRISRLFRIAQLLTQPVEQLHPTPEATND